MATKPKRPTAAQLDVLRKMRDGWRLWMHLPVRASWRCLITSHAHPGERKTIPHPTRKALLKAGLIERVEEKSDWRAEYYRLTPAGRSLLEQP